MKSAANAVRLSALRSQLNPRLSHYTLSCRAKCPQASLASKLCTMAAAPSIPTTQKGIVVSKTRGAEVLEYRTDLPVPFPKEGQVLVKNDLSGVNYIDIYFRTGLYPSPKPEVLGREGVGSIVALGPG